MVRLDFQKIASNSAEDGGRRVRREVASSKDAIGSQYES